MYRNIIISNNSQYCPVSVIRLRGGCPMIRIAIVEDEESYIPTLNEYLDRYQKEYSE